MQTNAFIEKRKTTINIPAAAESNSSIQAKRTDRYFWLILETLKKKNILANSMKTGHVLISQITIHYY